MYVDDEPGLLEIGRLFLEMSGDFEVTTIERVRDALQVLEVRQFDAIIADYQMPDMDGIRFLSLVRERFGRIPFILFTGRGREEVVIQAINSGVDFYLQKGGDPKSQFAELGHKVRQAVSRKKAEDTIREREEGYRHLIEHSDEAIGVIQDGIIRKINPAIGALTGYSAEELLGAPFLRFVYPDDRSIVAGRYEKRMRGEDALSQYPLRLIGKDGGTIWLEISTVAISWNGRPATITFLQNITRRIRAEQALVRTKDFLDRILNTIADPIFVKNEEHKRVLVNDAYCKVVGISQEEILMKNDRDLFPPQIADRLAQEDDHVFSTGLESAIEEEITDHDGMIHTILTKKDLFVSQEGQRFIVGISRDLTENRRSEEAFRQARQNYEAFFNNIDKLLYVVDETGKIISVNETLARRLGYPRTDLSGTPAEALFSLDEKDEAGRILQGMLAGTISSTTVPMLTRAGRKVPVETYVSRGEWDGRPALFCVSKETV